MATGTVSALSLSFEVLIPQAPMQMFPASSVSAEGTAMRPVAPFMAGLAKAAVAKTTEAMKKTQSLSMKS
jgi:hypothetical protein